MTNTLLLANLITNVIAIALDIGIVLVWAKGRRKRSV